MKNLKNFIFVRYSPKATRVVWTLGSFLFAFSIIVIWLVSGPHPGFPSDYPDSENKQ